MTDHEPTSSNAIDDDALEAAPPAADPRSTTTRVVRKGRRLPEQSAFLAWPAASSLIFLLSAACLLGGAWTVFANLGIDPDRIRERLAMVGTVHLYELALVGVAVLLCRFQRANPDAIGPVLLGACFLVGASVTLDLVSIDAPYLTLACGAAGLLLAFGKGRVLAHLAGGANSLMLLVPLALVMTWNLLWPAAMGLYLHYSTSGMASVTWWMPGWVIVLLSTAALVIGIVRDDGVGIERLRPFLRRSTLRWVLGLAIAACSTIHLLVLGYLHSLDVTLGEALPMIGLLCLGAVDLRHRAAGRARDIDRVLLSLPCGAALAAVLTQEHGVMSNPHAAGVVFTPALMLIAYAMAVWRLGTHRSQQDWHWAAAASAALGVLLWGADAHASTFNWSFAGVAITAGVAVRAVLLRQSTLLAKALVIGAAIALLQPVVVRWEIGHDLNPMGSVLAVTGMLVLTVALIWREGMRPAVARLALWLVTLGALTWCGRHAPTSLIAALSGALLIATHAVTWWRTRDNWAMVPLMLPTVLLMPSLMPENKGWLAVWAAFALLGVGVSLSWLRVRATQVARRPLPVAAHHGASVQPTSA